MLTPKQAWAIANLVHELRPEWDAEGIVRNLKPIADRDPFIVALASIRAAADKEARTPGVIPKPGTHWSEGVKRDRETSRPPRKGEECQVHVGNYATSCHGCQADRLVGDKTLPPELRRPDRANHLARVRAELASVRAALCPHGVDRARGRCVECKTNERTETEGAA